jgi:hypothetical protein
MRTWKDGGSRRFRNATLARAIGLASVGLVVALITTAPELGASAPSSTKVAPYHAGALPSSTLTTYSCHSKAKQLVPFHFSQKTGIASGAEQSSARACPQMQYRLGSQSQAAASGSEEVSVLMKIPTGTRNVTEHISLTYSATITEANGSVPGTCPSTPSQSISGQYYNGASWQYYPSWTGPVAYTNNTYYQYYETNGASGSCGSAAGLSGGFVAVMVASNGLAGYGMNGGSSGGASWSFGGSVATYASIYWSCYNYSLWDYGFWANVTGPCSSSNTTAYSSSYNQLNSTSGTLTSMTFTGTISFSMWYSADFHSVSPTWSIFLDPYGSTTASTYGFTHGSAKSTINLTTALKSITIV